MTAATCPCHSCARIDLLAALPRADLVLAIGRAGPALLLPHSQAYGTRTLAAVLAALLWSNLGAADAEPEPLPPDSPLNPDVNDQLLEQAS